MSDTDAEIEENKRRYRENKKAEFPQEVLEFLGFLYTRANPHLPDSEWKATLSSSCQILDKDQEFNRIFFTVEGGSVYIYAGDDNRLLWDGLINRQDLYKLLDLYTCAPVGGSISKWTSPEFLRSLGFTVEEEADHFWEATITSPTGLVLEISQNGNAVLREKTARSSSGMFYTLCLLPEDVLYLLKLAGIVTPKPPSQS